MRKERWFSRNHLRPRTTGLQMNCPVCDLPGEESLWPLHSLGEDPEVTAAPQLFFCGQNRCYPEGGGPSATLNAKQGTENSNRYGQHTPFRADAGGRREETCHLCASGTRQAFEQLTFSLTPSSKDCPSF